MIDLLNPIDLTADDIKILVEKHKTWLDQVVVNMQKKKIKGKMQIND